MPKLAGRLVHQRGHPGSGTDTRESWSAYLILLDYAGRQFPKGHVHDVVTRQWNSEGLHYLNINFTEVSNRHTVPKLQRGVTDDLCLPGMGQCLASLEMLHRQFERSSSGRDCVRGDPLPLLAESAIQIGQ